MLQIDDDVRASDQDMDARFAELERLNKELKDLMADTGIGIFFFDRDLRLQRFTPAVDKNFELVPPETGYPCPCEAHSLCYECLYEDAREVLATQNPFEREIETRSGDWYLVRMRPCHFDEAAGGVVITFVDITGQKQTQFHLRERVKELNCLLTIGELFSRTDAPLEALLQQTTALIPPSWQYPDITCARIVFQDQVFTTDTFQETLWRLSAGIVMLGERVGSVEVFYLEEKPRCDEGPFLHEERHLIEALARQLGVLAERKRIAELVVQERNRAQMYLDVAGTLFVALDKHGCVTLINQKGCEVLGYEAEEIVGKNWFDHFLPERLAEEVRSVFERLMAGEVEPVAAYENPVLTRTGEERCMLWQNTVIRDAEGRIVATLGSGTDITEQRALEREVLWISELERRRIGREFHDGLGSHLSGLAMLSRGMAQNVRKGRPVTPEDLDSLAELAQEGVLQARTLARGLNTVALDAEGLASALHELAINAQSRSGVVCSFADDTDLFVLSDEAVIQLYRIAQEALHNAIRHANATHIALRLHSAAGRLVLTVRDDGKGLPEMEHRRGGMGLRIMPYRAHMIGASFDIDSTPGGGAVVTCHLPILNAGLPIAQPLPLTT